MYDFSSETNFIIQGLLLVVMIGVFYNLMVTTHSYGGIIGKAFRLIGVGILFLCISMIERSLVNFAIIVATLNGAYVQDILSILGLTFAGFGFSKLARAAKK